MIYTKIAFDNQKHVFIIAEAGSNWKSKNEKLDLIKAKKLIDVAAKSGADAIKFKVYSSKNVYVTNAGRSNYLSKSGITKSINEIFDEFSMPYKFLKILSNYCKKKKIIFMSTPFSIKDAKAVDPYVHLHKIASYELNHLPLLKFIAKTKKPVLISTGASNVDEIDYAVSILKKFGSKQIGIMQCTAKYPAPQNSLNLSVIPELKKRYNLSIGLSDHSIDPFLAPLISYGLGATIIEKHFTLDKSDDGPDHFFALNPSELKNMISNIRNAEKTYGIEKKIILKEEKELRKFAVRSIHAITKIEKGDVFKLGINFEILRPGNVKRGADARFLDQIDGKLAKKSFNIDNGIFPKDCK